MSQGFASQSNLAIPVPIASGGTQATTAATARTNLGITDLVLQMVQTVDTTNRSTTSASYVTSNISASITPTTTSSRVRIQFYGLFGHSSASTISEYTIYRDAVALTPSGVNSMAASYVYNANSGYGMISIDFIDSPSTTSAITYALYFRTSGGTTYLGRRGSDTTIDNCNVITVTELRS